MADVTIVAAASVDPKVTHGLRNLVFIDSNTGYFFYVNTAQDLAYRKTTDGGATWGADVVILAGSCLAFDIWFDEWTPGRSGGLIHAFYIGSAVDDVFYRTIDTANADALGTQRVVFAGATAVAGAGNFVSGAVMRGGNIFCAFDMDAGAEKGFYRSVDNGVNWASRDATLVEATLDWALVFPGNEADANDCWILYLDVSANALTLKMHDDSAGTTSESATIATIVEGTTDATAQWPFHGMIRHSDGHLIATWVTEFDLATSDHGVADINGTASIVQKTAITTNIDDHYWAQVFMPNVGPNANDIYVFYTGKRDGSEGMGATVGVYYTKSTDGGGSWSAGDTLYADTAGNLRQVWSANMGERACAAFRVSTNEIRFNKVNSVVITVTNNYVLDAQPGSFAHAGVAAGTVAGRAVNAVPGSYSSTGFQAQLVRGFAINGQAGAYAHTGFAATLLEARVLNAAPGAYSHTGFAATLAVARSLLASPGAYVVTGFDATLSYGALAAGFTLDAQPGAYAHTGVAASLIESRQMNAAPGAYSHTGFQAQLPLGRFLNAVPGAYNHEGSLADLVKQGLPQHYVLAADPGAYVVTGFDAMIMFVPGRPPETPAEYRDRMVRAAIETSGRGRAQSFPIRLKVG